MSSCSTARVYHDGVELIVIRTLKHAAEFVEISTLKHKLLQTAINFDVTIHAPLRKVKPKEQYIYNHSRDTIDSLQINAQILMQVYDVIAAT